MICELADRKEAGVLSLPMTENYRLYRYDRDGKSVFFSCSRQGNAMAIHLAADRDGKRLLRDAVNKLCEFIFENYDWCEVIVGVIGKKSVINLAKKCGFSILGEGTATVNGSKQKATVVGRWP